MNKKILLLVLILAVLALPAISHATDLKSIVGAVKTGLTGLGGGLATIGFIVAGILFIASTANPSLMSTAKGALVAAVIGIVIILLASTACQFVNDLTGAGGQCLAPTSQYLS